MYVTTIWCLYKTNVVYYEFLKDHDFCFLFVIAIVFLTLQLFDKCCDKLLQKAFYIMSCENTIKWLNYNCIITWWALKKVYYW